MNRRNFIKGAGAVVALAATGIKPSEARESNFLPPVRGIKPRKGIDFPIFHELHPWQKKAMEDLAAYGTTVIHFPMNHGLRAGSRVRIYNVTR